MDETKPPPLPVILPHIVQLLAELHLNRREIDSRIVECEAAVLRSAVELGVVSAPVPGEVARFVCAGKLVELSCGPFGKRSVQLLEIESLPNVVE